MSATFRAAIRHTPLMLALLLGVVVGTALAFIPNQFPTLTRALIAWDAAISVYLISIVVHARGLSPKQLTAHAAETDDGRYFVLFVSLAAVLASITAIMLELQARLEPGVTKNLHLAFVFLTVALSWLFVHASFAKHYTHEYFGPAGKGEIRKGLIFPGNEEPDFADFVHFAIVIGVANQTADIQIAAKPVRRIVTLHGVAAFVFNTVILALTINLAAGLFN